MVPVLLGAKIVRVKRSPAASGGGLDRVKMEIDDEAASSAVLRD
jgi:hypothetical protein